MRRRGPRTSFVQSAKSLKARGGAYFSVREHAVPNATTKLWAKMARPTPPPTTLEKLERILYNALSAMKKQTFLTILGFAVSIVLLYFSLRGIEFRQIWSLLKQTNPGMALLPLVFIGTAICLSAFRWSKVAGSNVRFRETFTALLIGMFVNNIMPARMGEVARGYVLSHKTGPLLHL